MRTITYGDQRIDVKILSLCRAREPVGRGAPPGHNHPAQVALLSPVEIPLGATFTLANANEDPFHAQALGCVRNANGHFLVLGSIRS